MLSEAKKLVFPDYFEILRLAQDDGF